MDDHTPSAGRDQWVGNVIIDSKVHQGPINYTIYEDGGPRNAAKQDLECFQHLRVTDPRHDKKRIEDTKGGLLKDSYRWILENPDFQRWRDDQQSRLLWIKGDPGKGKTMLLCGIANELMSSMAKTALLSYFFCQATDSRINTATAVLRGLLYLLVNQQPSLILHVRKKYDSAGKAFFEDTNAWVALTEIFTDVLQDPSLNTTYLIIDALDECITDLPKLLDFVVKQSSASSHVKWIVSSRNWPNIEERLERAGHKVRLSLELNAESVSKAVSIFIKQKVSQLARQKKYNERTRDAVRAHLASNANDTFLWVALVCQDLEVTSKWSVLKKLNLFPPGLDSLYGWMMQRINKSDDAELCKQLLASIALVYRPITLEELAALVEQLEDIADDPESIREIIALCGSFLTLREETIYFAAKEVFLSGREDVHYTIFARSLETMFRTLQRDMYGLEALGYPVEDVKQPDPDPLAASHYSCMYWVDHLRDSNLKSSAGYVDGLREGGVVDVFLRKKYLYWLEALSLYKSVPKAVVSMAELWLLVQLVHDVYRFVMYHKGAIESSPLQAYTSALLFSPTKSLIRRQFQHEEPKWITIKPAPGASWSACLQTLEGHSRSIWDASSGACLQTLEGHSDSVTLVAFSYDSTRLASASYDRTVKIWDASSGACLQMLEGYSGYVSSVAFSHDLTWLASASDDGTVKIWDASSSACLQTLKGHSGYVSSVAFSHDSTWLASASDDRTVKIWDASSGACLQTLKISKVLNNISFDITGSYLHTEIGAVSISVTPLVPSRTPTVIEPQNARYQGLALSSDGTWITHNSKNLVWLPSEYRPSCSAVIGKKIGIGAGSGRVWICHSFDVS
ncbi:WD40 repeat-like protein [Byssothecium circinans]|uniref:WD40 repeat-like protein n=1 Tax=Byssothecium circinans TaxID=147558 RepID=A0A6A5U6D4_9PLEO|nr:WD40 repeat-like protein [Byssothecium circinans]